jgi:hypothetical protein
MHRSFYNNGRYHRTTRDPPSEWCQSNDYRRVDKVYCAYSAVKETHKLLGLGSCDFQQRVHPDMAHSPMLNTILLLFYTGEPIREPSDHPWEANLRPKR